MPPMILGCVVSAPRFLFVDDMEDRYTTFYRIAKDYYPNAVISWAENADEALMMLQIEFFSACWLDHDFGEDGVLGYGERSGGDGVALAKAMVKTALLPPLIIVHSWNPDGAKRMIKTLEPFSKVMAFPFGEVTTHTIFRRLKRGEL